MNCDWFITLSAPVVIGQSNCFGHLKGVIASVIFDSHLKTALKEILGEQYKFYFICGSELIMIIMALSKINVHTISNIFSYNKLISEMLNLLIT